MDPLFAARAGMGLSLAFHILFAMVGMNLPVLILAAELRAAWLDDLVAADLARRWTKGLAVLFAVGAVSGTVLSFELGLLWPGFMKMAGPAVGFLFAMEGFAFFLEAIFLGIYLYGRDRISTTARLAACAGIALTGNLSAVFVVMVNGWMNDPVGARFDGTTLVDLDPLAILMSPAGWSQVVHMVLAASAAIPFVVAGIHAAELRRTPGDVLHKTALSLALVCATVPALLLPVTGHYLAQRAASENPGKLAAMEAHWHTERGAGLVLGGWPDEVTQTTSFALHIPYALSLLATNSLDGEVVGWADIPARDRPPVLPVHIAFQIMVAAGSLMCLVVLLGVDRLRRGGDALEAPWFLKLVIFASPAGLLATEAGWVVTEVGRQPWVIRGILRTAEASTSLDGNFLGLRVAGFLLVYAALGGTVLYFLAGYVQQTRGPRDAA